ncbi:hypothetical protein B0H17DRAFT_1124800 [Mycena rosella]|uniref:Alcohol dehydrogenase-like N-terminal domain-containing protein n=1 Tax=Mycena rosella TaxID=1033263 RepID=A0AAD7GZZ9_MYCRO|nr:hypothetical protein B0H17DRAFT_1124800 [Mycena rosella]
MSQLALVYKSAAHSSAQGNNVIKSRPIPEPINGHVQVRVEAAGVVPIDYKIYDYGLGFVHKYPTVPGIDAAGEVTKLGPGVGKFKSVTVSLLWAIRISRKASATETEARFNSTPWPTSESRLRLFSGSCENIRVLNIISRMWRCKPDLTRAQFHRLTQPLILALLRP